MHLLSDTAGGGNGVYAYGSTSSFPSSTFSATNYWVDVVFQPQATGPDTTSPTVLSVTPPDAATGISINSSLSAVFNEPLDLATVSTSTVELRDASNALVSASVSYDAATRTARLTPNAALSGESTYTATLKGGSVEPVIRDVAGNPLVANVSWSFTTAAPLNCSVNPIVAENCLAGNPASEWDIVGAGDTEHPGLRHRHQR